ncbi:hypothetical protein NW857_05010, partial [Synechococcus sp. H55.9]|uniref:hypothetical protein n=1 Tax=Synechococcus sp. H55.9 TaxID=2964511 RepID=UPI0039C461AF
PAGLAAIPPTTSRSTQGWLPPAAYWDPCFHTPLGYPIVNSTQKKGSRPGSLGLCQSINSYK